MKTLKVRLTFTEPLLGTWPANQNVAREYIASKGPDAATIEDEVAALGADAAADKVMTVFPRNEAGQPILYDYQVKGFFKDSCGMLGRIGGKDEKGKKKAVNESGKLTAYKKIIDGLIFVGPRQIPLILNGEMTECQRPLRAQTAQGERVSLAQLRADSRRQHLRVRDHLHGRCPRKGGSGMAGLRQAPGPGPVAQQRQRPLHLRASRLIAKALGCRATQRQRMALPRLAAAKHCCGSIAKALIS